MDRKSEYSIEKAYLDIYLNIHKDNDDMQS